jgi:hypothetical protein
VAARVRLRHTVETVAATNHDLPSFLAGLRDAGLLVRERYSEQHPGEVTGYAVALPGPHDGPAPVWYGGAKLAADLSLPKLQTAWTSGPDGDRRRTGRIDAADRPALWREATDAAAAVAADVRRLAHQDPAAAGAAARAAADVLHVAARVGEPTGRGALHDAARAYDRASRELHGRTPRSGPGAAQLRLAAVSLGLLARAARDEHAAVLALTAALAGLVDAVAELRTAQRRVEQAAAARAATVELRTAATAPLVTTASPAARPVLASRTPEPQSARHTR